MHVSIVQAESSCALGAKKTATKKQPAKVKGIFEKLSGSRVWWVRVAGKGGKIHREKAGTREAAGGLYRMRKTEVLPGKKLPEKLRARKGTFSQLATDALTYSEKNRRSFFDGKYRLKKVRAWFGETTGRFQQAARHRSEITGIS